MHVHLRAHNKGPLKSRAFEPQELVKCIVFQADDELIEVERASAARLKHLLGLGFTEEDSVAVCRQ
jgi:hypothetical protein